MCGIKCLMNAFNVLFLLLGLGIAGLGIWLRLDGDAGNYIDDSDSFNALYAGSYVFIGVGVVIILLAIVGICGTVRMSQCLLMVFFIGLFIISAILLAIGVVALTQMDVVKESFGDHLMTKVKDYDNEDSRTYMTNFQNTFDCCGAKHGASDYGLNLLTLDAKCKPANVLTPCADAFFETLSPNIKVTAGVAFGAAFIMIVGMVLSMHLCCAIRKA